MYLSSLSVENFRNIKKTEIKGLKRVNIFTGNNAQGKTNFLESIYFLSSLTSGRAQTNLDLIQWNKDFFFVQGKILSDNIEKTIDTRFTLEKEFNIRINGKQISKKSEYIGLLTAVRFYPEDIDIVKKSPADRRRNLNLLLSQGSRAYLKTLQRYTGIVVHKNTLLKKMAGSGRDDKALSAWNEQLAKEGAELLKKRIEAVDFLNSQIKGIHSLASGNTEELMIVYKSTVPIKDNIEAAFLEKLETVKQDEIIRRSSLAGPHRDDLAFMINNRDAKHFASEGQQRAVIFSLRAAEYEYLRKETKEEPIVLIDDVFYELDEERRRNTLSLFLHLPQIFIAITSDKKYADYFSDAKVFHVESGAIIDG